MTDLQAEIEKMTDADLAYCRDNIKTKLADAEYSYMMTITRNVAASSLKAIEAEIADRNNRKQGVMP